MHYLRLILSFSLFSVIFLCSSSHFVSAQTLYSKAYGEKQHPAVVFIHGGPGGNSTLFEATTAQKLADKGFYVIVYDRRGEGRSADSTATLTYDEAFKDLNEILQLYSLSNVTLIGHSFGGLVATLFTDRFPEKVNALILAGALVSQQETYNHILSTIKRKYKSDRNTSMLTKLSEIEHLDKNSAAYRKECYEMASLHHYFEMPNPTQASEKLRADYESGVFYKQNIRNQKAPLLFYKNETLRNIDTKNILTKRKAETSICAIYGKQDSIFSSKQLQDIKNIVTADNFVLLENCSHYLFVDQQSAFIDMMVKWIK